MVVTTTQSIRDPIGAVDLLQADGKGVSSIKTRETSIARRRIALDRNERPRDDPPLYV